MVNISCFADQLTTATISLTPKNPTLGTPLVLLCTSDGFPEASFTITHNDSVVSATNKFTICEIKWTDAGTYKCVATNVIGSATDSKILKVLGKIELPECQLIISSEHRNTI